MKRILLGLILIIAVLSAGCTTSTQSSATTTTTTPDLTGKWTGSMTAYVNGTGYVSSPAGTMTMIVTDQNGRVFNGTMIFTDHNQTTETLYFAGAISNDGKTITLVNEAGGYDTGTLVSRDEIELVYVSDSHPFTVSIDSLKRA